MEEAIQKLYDWYLAYEDELEAKYKGKILLIGNSRDLTVFDKLSEAYQSGKSQYGLGNFILQECSRVKRKVLFYPGTVNETYRIIVE